MKVPTKAQILSLLETMFPRKVTAMTTKVVVIADFFMADHSKCCIYTALPFLPGWHLNQRSYIPNFQTDFDDIETLYAICCYLMPYLQGHPKNFWCEIRSASEVRYTCFEASPFFVMKNSYATYDVVCKLPDHFEQRLVTVETLDAACALAECASSLYPKSIFVDSENRVFVKGYEPVDTRYKSIVLAGVMVGDIRV